jgi:Ferritin-like
LQHFLYLERPEGMDLVDAPEFAVLAIPQPGLTLDDDQIVPQTQDFATIGHLYRGIEQGFRHLVEKYGEQRVFIGPPRAQATQQYFGWPELIAVTDLASACQAIETIIEEGEGAHGD